MGHRSCRRAWLLGVLVGVLALALGAPSLAFAAGIPQFPWVVPQVSPGPVAVHIQGTGRYLTAVEASKKFASASTVVVASGEAFPDALGGAALAGAVDGPLLLTPKGSVPKEVLAEIARLGATKVYVLGSSNAVSDAAFAQLDAAVATVVRLGGNTRFETAKLVADEAIAVLGGSYSGEVFLATGQNFPDALAAAPVMYAKGIPLVLVNKTGGFTLPASATKAIILGGTGSVPASVETALGSKFEDRIAGGGRYATAVLIAEYGVSLGMGWDNLGIATGQNFPDALCAGPLVGSKNAVLLLTTSASLQAEAGDCLAAHKGEISRYYLFGGASALSDAACSEIAETLAPAVRWEGHSLPDVSCTQVGCHDTELATIHIAKGCYMCHSAGVEPSNDCIACHGDNVHDAPAIHAGIESVPATDAESCTQADCHGSAGAMAFHTGGCAECHASSRPEVRDAIKVGGATCESCHEFATVHDGGNDDHAIAGEDCFSSSCHGGDVAKMHTTDFRGTGDMPPGCVACHGAGKTPSKTCTSCHANLATKHDAGTQHSGVEPTMSGSKSAACVSCHGTNLMNVASGQHIGCSCHAYNEVRGASECVDCHDKQYAAHGFVDGFAHGGGWLPVSGHSTPTYGKRGVFEDFSSFAVTDTAGNSIDTTTWPFPNQDVFWAKDDPTAPAGAMTGLTKDSVVACEDCHSGLKAYEVAGPHGGNVIANAGLDPAFNGSFDTAYLWGAGDASVTVDAQGNGVWNKAGGTRFLSASGIAQYVPTMVGGETGEELVDWDVTSGNAKLQPGKVICVKCHDLYNSGTGMLGWSNYGHEHHADRPVRYGLFQRADLTTYTADAMADRAGGDTTITAPSLGRETAGACRDCHIAIPHGWKRPRLIVYSNLPDAAFRTSKGLTAAGDEAPYNAGPSVYEGEGIAGTAVGSGQMNGVASRIGPKPTTNPANGTGTYNNWSSSQCNACGHHSGTNLTAGDWK